MKLRKQGKKVQLVTTILMITSLLFSSVATSMNVRAVTSKSALKAYKKFLTKNQSHFKVAQGDWEKKNRENYQKTSCFLITNLDGKGVPELICNHPVGCKRDYLYIYTYKHGKVTLMRSKAGSKKINISCNAAGWYEVYGCQKGCLHTKWSDGMFGSEKKRYRSFGTKWYKVANSNCKMKNEMVCNNKKNRNRII